MKIIIYITALWMSLLSIPQSGFADKPVAQSILNKRSLVEFPSYSLFSKPHVVNETISHTVTSATCVDLNIPKLSSLVMQAPEVMTLNIPYNGSNISVELEKVNIFTEDFSVITSENTKLEYTPGIYYRGIIGTNPNSIAAFSFFNGELYGIVSDDAVGNLIVSRVVRQGNTSEYIIYSDKNLRQNMLTACKTSATNQEVFNDNAAQPESNPTVKCVRLYYEVDNTLYQNNNSNSVNATNWITAVHNNVSALFANDNISVALSQVFIWTTADPFIGIDEIEQLAFFHTTRTSFNGDVGQLVAKDDNYDGLADTVNGLCTPLNYSYTDNEYHFNTVPTYSWTVQTVTHEFGHLMGSWHTHNCNWAGGAIDDCGPVAGFPTEGGCPAGPTPVGGGTIMSYCFLTGSGINFNNGFGPLPEAAITNIVNSAACLGTTCAPCPAPAHNSCSTPSPLIVSSQCVSVYGNLCGATETNAPITCNSRTAAHAYDVWYSFVPNQTDLVIKCQSGSATDLVVGLYSGTCGAPTLLSCADATTTGGLETITTTVTIGSTYYIRVYDFNGNSSGVDFGICLTHNCLPVTNDSCQTPINLNITTACTYITGELCAPTQSLLPEDCSGFISATANDLWYTITPPQSNVTLTVQGNSAADIVLGVYSGTCGNLTLVRCTDTTTSGGVEIWNDSLGAGSTYFVRVYDWNANTGAVFQLCAKYTPCAAPITPGSASSTIGTICPGDSTTLNVTGTLSPGATWVWYEGACSGVSIDTGASIRVAPTATTTYYVRAERNGCVSACKNTTVNVIPLPSAPGSINASSNAVCAGGSSTLVVLGSLSVGATWHWYTGSCGGTPAGTGDTIVVTPGSTTTYYVRAENGSCFTTCATTSVSVVSAPANPTSASGNSPVCAGSNSTLSVSGTLSPGATWHWYSGSCGGTAVGTGSSLNVSPSSNTTYYVRAEIGSCYSTCVNTSVTITPGPTAPTSVSGTSPLCAGQSSTLQVNGTLSPGATWQWYSGSCGGTAAGTGISITVTPGTTTTYYVRAENGTCNSSCASKQVIVTAIPTNPVSASGVTPVCSGGTTTLQVQGTLSSGATWHWYTGSCGGTPIGTGALVNATLASNTTYYVRAENGSCLSNCVNTSVNIISPPNAPVSASGNSPVCSGTSVNLTVTGTLTPGATWTWYAGSCGGGTSVGTGATIPVTPSSTTSYFVRAEIGGCFSTTCQSTTINVNLTPVNPDSISGPVAVCVGGSATLQVNGTLSPGAVWNWYSSSCGGTLIDTGNTITVSPLNNALYFVRAINGSCISNCSSHAVSIVAQPNDPVSATAASPVCLGVNTMLNVSGSLAPGSDWAWYSDSCGGNFVGNGDSLTVLPTATGNYYVRAEHGACVSGCQSAAITVVPLTSPLPIVASDTVLCAGELLTLTQNGVPASGGNWYWYKDSCGGTFISLGTLIFVVPSSTSTYYVRAEDGNCLSVCESFTINILPLPASPLVNINIDTLSVPPVYSSYQWYYSSDGLAYITLGITDEIKAIYDGYYFVFVTDSNGCGNSSDTVLIIDPLSIKEIDGLQISVYPNPVSEELNVVVHSASEKINLRIFDATARLVYSANPERDKTHVIPVSNFAAGIYELLFESEGRIYLKKILKQ